MILNETPYYDEDELALYIQDRLYDHGIELDEIAILKTLDLSVEFFKKSGIIPMTEKDIQEGLSLFEGDEFRRWLN